jgi:hypothetical protein
MPIEHASVRAMLKPRGVSDLERADGENASLPALLLKLSFTSAPLTALIAYPATAPVDSLLQRLCKQSTNPIYPAAPDVPELTGLAEART